MVTIDAIQLDLPELHKTLNANTKIFQKLRTAKMALVLEPEKAGGERATHSIFDESCFNAGS